MDLAEVMGGQTFEPVVKDEVAKERRGQGHSWRGGTFVIVWHPLGWH